MVCVCVWGGVNGQWKCGEDDKDRWREGVGDCKKKRKKMSEMRNNVRG